MTEIEAKQQDAEAVKAVLGGDLNRYEELVRRHERQVYAVAWSRLGNAAMAQEAAQESLIRGFQRLSQLTDGSKFAGWITTMARNSAINLCLKHRREMNKRERWTLEQADATTETSEEEDEVCSVETLRENLEKLPATLRECLVLFYLEGKSGAEAATALGVSEATFRVKLHRARTSLRGKLDQRAARSLGGLRPANALAGAVMAGVLASSSSAKAAGIGGAAAAGASAVKGSSWLWSKALFSLGWALPGALFDWWLNRLEAANFVEADGFRARLHKSENLRRILMIPVLGLMIWMGEGLQELLLKSPEFVGRPSQNDGFLSIQLSEGARGLFIGIAVLSGCVVLHFLRAYRNGPNRYWLIQTAFFSITTVLILSIGMGWLPLFAVALLMPLSGLLLSYSLRFRPAKMDYNLMLRASQSMLVPACPESGSVPVKIVESKDLLRFSRFLGSRFLTTSVDVGSDGVRLFLNPVRPRSLGNSFRWTPSLKKSVSSVFIRADGTVTAQCGENDALDIAALNPEALPEIEAWQYKVETAVAAALRAFLAGDPVLAEKALGEVPDTEIFKKPVHRAPVARWMWNLELINVGITLILFGIIGVLLWFLNR